jgi:hypothetical protein
MNKRFFSIFGAIAFWSLILFSGCDSKNATTGTITIQVIDYKTNLPIPNELIYIASSYANLKKHIWLNQQYSDANGKAFFRDLTPMVLYYDTEHWENYGAAQIYAGIDQSVLLYVNELPLLKK